MSATIRLLCSVLIAAACSGLVAADVSEAGRRPVDAKAAASDHLRKVQAEGSWTDDFEGAAETAAPKRARPARAPPAGAKPQEHYYFEAAFVLFLLCCGINIILGRRQNEKLAKAWAREFITEGSILEQNFSSLGAGAADGGIVRKQSQSNFQFYATGRRYCTGMVTTLELRPRQDLVSMTLLLLEPRDDKVQIEVCMGDTNMPPFCLAVGLTKVTKTLLKDQRDLTLYAKPMDVTRDRIKDWPPSLAVVSESAAVFYDLFSEGLVEHAFGTQAYQTLTGKYFRYLHFSSDFEATGRKVLRFSFKLPPADKMHELARLMDTVMKFIDVVGSYQMGPKLREKAEKVRAEERKKADSSKRATQDEEVQRKKQERREAEQAKIKLMTPAARQKYEEKQEAIRMRRVMKKRTIK